VRDEIAAGSNVTVVLGTRPEIIKLAPVIQALERRLGPAGVSVIDTGQHYDASMSGRFWEEFGLREPERRLAAGGMSRAQCLGYLLAELGADFERRRPDAVLVQGDTNSTVAGALAANATGIPLVHVEAGLRSFDRRMPEEHNRVVTDHLSDLCCAATADNVHNLESEGISASAVLRTGNTIVEAVASQLPDPEAQAAVRSAHDVEPGRYVLATVHRPENTDDPQALTAILAGLRQVGREHRLPVLVPLHPRTRAAVERAGGERLLDGLRVMDPLGSVDFLSLAASAAVIVSDSGGIAEEVTILKRPLVIVRRSTERAESIWSGFATLVWPDEVHETASGLLSDAGLLGRLATTPSPYGDGTAAERIVEATIERFVLPSDGDTRDRAALTDRDVYVPAT